MRLSRDGADSLVRMKERVEYAQCRVCTQNPFGTYTRARNGLYGSSLHTLHEWLISAVFSSAIVVPVGGFRNDRDSAEQHAAVASHLDEAAILEGLREAFL